MRCGPDALRPWQEKFAQCFQAPLRAPDMPCQEVTGTENAVQKLSKARITDYGHSCWLIAATKLAVKAK